MLANKFSSEVSASFNFIDDEDVRCFYDANSRISWLSPVRPWLETNVIRILRGQRCVIGE